MIRARSQSSTSRERRERALERGVRELPLPAPVVDDRDPVLDRREPLRLGQGGRRLVARERAGVVAGERPQVADVLVERRGLGMSERERLAEVRERLGVRVQVARALAGDPVPVGRLRLAAGEPQVLGDRACEHSRVRAGGERLGGAAVEQPPPPAARRS